MRFSTLGYLLFALAWPVFFLSACGDDNEVSVTAEAPVGCIQGNFTHYFGMLHAHTSYSDGMGTPQQAYDLARHTAGLDVFAVTDHLELLYLPFPVPDKWELIKNAADAANAGNEFVALAGFEYSSGFELSSLESWGHNNVFFSQRLFPMIMLDFHKFYNQLLADPGAIGQFNHPWRSEETNWDQFAYDAAVDNQMNLMEMDFRAPNPLPFLFQALDKGWHLSPTSNQDNHDPDWGVKDHRGTGFWMGGLTREDVRDCMLDRRTFATDDRAAWISLKTQEHGCWMGSILSGVSTIKAKVVAESLDGQTFDRIEMWGPGQTHLGGCSCDGAASCKCTLPVAFQGSGYVLATALQGDEDILISAPIWLEAP